jgi:hypothetical protein
MGGALKLVVGESLAGNCELAGESSAKSNYVSRVLAHRYQAVAVVSQLKRVKLSP